jgi:hypothetical protein
MRMKRGDWIQVEFLDCQPKSGFLRLSLVFFIFPCFSFHSLLAPLRGRFSPPTRGCLPNGVTGSRPPPPRRQVLTASSELHHVGGCNSFPPTTATPPTLGVAAPPPSPVCHTRRHDIATSRHLCRCPRSRRSYSSLGSGPSPPLHHVRAYLLFARPGPETPASPIPRRRIAGPPVLRPPTRNGLLASSAALTTKPTMKAQVDQ